MDLNLIFLDLKFKMIEDGYTNIKIDKTIKGNYILKADDLRKPESIFTALITNGHVNCLIINGTATITIKEYNLLRGITTIDCEYALTKNAITKRLQTSRNVEY